MSQSCPGSFQRSALPPGACALLKLSISMAVWLCGRRALAAGSLRSGLESSAGKGARERGHGSGVCSSTELPRWCGVQPGLGPGCQQGRAWCSRKGDTVMQLGWYNFDSVLELLFFPRCGVFSVTHGNTVFLKVMVGTKFFSILRMFI